MKSKRRFTSEFKAKVVLAALQEKESTAELAKREWRKPYWQAREYQHRWNRGGLTRSSDLCQVKALET